MNRYKNPSLNGTFTYICEGTNNPHSKSFSRRLHLSAHDNILIGRGYNITTHTSKQIIDDFTGLGITYKKAEVLCRGTNIRGVEAQKFVRNNKNELMLTPDQETRLYELEYSRLNAQLSRIFATSEKRYGVISEDQILPYQWEILMDFLMSGDMQVKTQDMLIVALKKSIDRENPQVFDLSLMDVEYWKKTGINEDRAKMRAIFVREWEKMLRMFENSRQASSEESLIELLFQSPNIFTIQGFFIDNDVDSLSMLLKRHSPTPHIKKDPKDDGATFGDLVLCLKVYYDFTITSKSIGGSLNPTKILQGDADGIYKEFYPDKEKTSQIIESTRFGDIFSEASLVISQIAGGAAIKRKGDRLERGEFFEYPDELRNAGILPLDALKNKTRSLNEYGLNKTKNHLKEIAQAAKIGIVVWAKSSSNSMVKFWLVAQDYEDVQTVNNNGEYYVVKDVKLAVEAHKLVVTSKGEFREMPVEDPDDPALYFAKMFTENMELISKHYPVFKRVKQIFKAILMAQWLFNKKIPVDMSIIKDFYQRELLHMVSPQNGNFTNTPSKHLKIGNMNLGGSSPLGSPLQMGNLSLGSNNSSPLTRDKFYSPTSRDLSGNPWGSPKEIPSSGHHITKGTADFGFRSSYHNKFSSIERHGKTSRDDSLPFVGGGHKLSIFAGVLLDFKHRKSNLTKLIGRIEQNDSKDFSFGRTGKKIYRHDDSISMNKSSSKKDFGLDFENGNLSSIVFPFQKATCVVCQAYLKHSEITKPANGNYFCRLHHPLSCNYCFSICRDQVISIEDGKYHPHCLKCRHCGGPLKEKLIKTKEGFIHSACMGDYLRELCEANKLNELFVGDDDGKGKEEQEKIKFTGIMKKGGSGTVRENKKREIRIEKRVHLLSKVNTPKDNMSLDHSMMSHRSNSPMKADLEYVGERE